MGTRSRASSRTSIHADGHAPVHIFASTTAWVEGNARQQLEQVAALPGIRSLAAMPDLHPGKFGPVGCGILADRIYPQFVGSDIGCGMGLFQLDVRVRKLRIDKLANRLGHLDAPWDGDIEDAREGADLTPTPYDGALGSIGGGNHFCEFQAVETIADEAAAQAAGLDRDRVCVLVHSGSRGLGHAILTQYLPDLATPLDPDDDTGRNYMADHNHAVRWARTNRAIIAGRAAEAARADVTCINDLAHNMAEEQMEGSTRLILHRKGAAPTDRGLIPVPGSRGTRSYLMAPHDGAAAEALSCLAHGAGRKYDRSSMHGRVKTKKSDLARLKQNGFGGTVICEDRRLLVEEAPDAYKNIEAVIDDLVSFGLATVVATFRPLVTFKTAVNRAERAQTRSRDKSERRLARREGRS